MVVAEDLVLRVRGSTPASGAGRYRRQLFGGVCFAAGAYVRHFCLRQPRVRVLSNAAKKKIRTVYSG